jgi:hypothetical protein
MNLTKKTLYSTTHTVENLLLHVQDKWWGKVQGTTNDHKDMFIVERYKNMHNGYACSISLGQYHE